MIMQRNDIKNFTDHIAINYPIKNVIEIGTAFGDFTRILAASFPRCQIHTIDNKSHGQNFSDVKNITQHFFDALSLEEISANKSKLLTNFGPALILCDNGNKALEMSLWANILFPLDIIMCHDFAVSKEDFQSRGINIWNCCEVTEGDIDMTKLRRHDSLFNIGLNYAWGVYQLR